MSITFVFIFVAWIFSLCIHEFSHAMVAYKGGDYTVKDKGYLSLNPLKFTDPFLSIILPMIILLIGGLGLPGGCVYIEKDLLRSRMWDCLVSLAGPASNLVLAILIASPFYLGFVSPDTKEPLWDAMAFLVVLQLLAMLFNLIPIPGFDRFAAVSAWMNHELRAKIYQYSNIAFFAFILILWNVEAAQRFLWVSVFLMASLLGVNPEMAIRGLHEFMIF